MTTFELTKTAESLRLAREEGAEELTDAEEALATCMGSEDFSYALFEGGYLHPEHWVQGESLEKLREAIALVGEFKKLVKRLHEEF